MKRKALALLLSMAVATTLLAGCGSGDKKEDTKKTEAAAEDAKEKVEEAADDAKEAVEEAADDAKDAAEDVKDAAEEAADSAADAVNDAAEDAGEALDQAGAAVEEAAGDAAEKAEEAVEEAKEGVEEAAEEAGEAVEEAKEGVEEAVDEAKEGAEEAVEKAGEAVEEAAEEVKEGAEEAVDEAKEAAEEVKEDAEKALDEAGEAVDEAKEEAEEAVEEAAEEVKEGAEEVKEGAEEAADKAEEAAEEVKEDAEKALDEAGEAVEEAKDEAEEAVDEAKEGAEEAVDEAKEEAEGAVEEATEEVEEAAEEAKEEAEGAVEEAAEEVEEKADEAKEEAEEAVEEATEEVKEEAKDEEKKDEEKKAEETKEEAGEEYEADSLYPDNAGVSLKAASYNEAAPDWTEYTELIAQIKTETDAEKRVALMHQAEDILMATGAVIPIYYYNDLYLQKTDVEGIYSNLFGFKFFQFATCPRDVLKVNLASEPAKIDPALNSSVDGACLDVNLFAGLYTYDADGNLQPDLADPENPYEVSDDGLVYTFHLLDGLKWSDGTDVTAKDFEYAWKRCADPKTAADYAYMFDCFALADDGTINVKATDDRTLVATLNAPCAYFLDLCAFPAYLPVPQAQVEAQSDWEINPGAWAAEAGFVTNGAYTVKEWKHEESMVFVKNPNYHKADQVSIEEIDFMLSADDTAIFAAYNSDDLDFADTVPTNEIANIKENEDFHVIDNLGTYYAAFNVNSPIFEGKTVEQAVAMRKAFSLLIDRQYIVDNVGQTEQKVATSFIPAGMADGNGGVFKANTDAYVFPIESSEGYYPVYEDGVEDEAIDCARKFLEIAGYKFNEDGTLSDETPINITYLTNDGTGHIAVAESMQQDFDTLGIKMSIETREWNVFLDERKQGNFDFAREGWLADFNDPINMLEMWTPQSGNNDCQFGKDPNAAAEEEAEEEETEEAAVEETTEETAEEATDAAAAEAADETAEEAGAEDAEEAEEAGEETGLAEAGAAAAGAVATAVAAGAEDAEAAVEEAVDEAEEAVEETVEAAEEAVEETKEAVEETVDEAKEAVEETVEAVEEAVTQNAEEAKNALNKTVKSAEEETAEAVEEAADEAEEAVEETAEEVEETAEEATEEVEEAAEEATEAVEEAAEEVKEEAAEAVEEPKDEEKKDEETKEEAEEEKELDGDSLYPDGAGVALKPASYNEAAPDWTEYTDLIAQIKTETDAEKRVALMHQAEDILMATGAVIPIYYYNDLYLQKTDVEGIYSNLFGFKFFQFATCPRDVLKVNLASEPAKVDPALNSSVDGACLDVNLFAGLYTYDADGNLQPDLADPANPYEVSDDGLVYTFHLLDGLKWSDGTPVTAKDFEYAWKRCADPKTAADYAYMFDCFALAEDGTINVEATDDLTLVATLNAPCAYFLDLCAFPAYLPVPQAQVEAQEDWEINPGAWAAEAGFVTNGAYTVKEWKHEESMVFVKNPNYHKADQVTIEEIDFMLSADDTAIFAAYNSDDLDFADTVPTNEIANIKENEDFHVIDNLGTYYAAFNVNSPIFEGKTVQQAVAMRKAFALLIDRQYIIDNIGQTEQKAASSFIPAGMADGNGGIFKENSDSYIFPWAESEGYYPIYEDGVEDEAIDCARKYLEIAGYKFNEDGTLSDETPINITYLTNESTGHVAIAESMQQDFDTLGIKMSIETREWNVFLDERKQGNFDFAREGWLADFNDPINMLEMWTPQSGNNDCQFGKDPNAAAE